jgi:hypothetical protein
MTRSTLFLLALATLGAGPMLAQRPAPSPLPSPKADKPEDISARLIGTWQGPYQADQASPGTLKLAIAKEAEQWKVTLQVQTDQPIDAAEVRDFTVDGNQVTWAQDVMGMECKTTAMLENGNLKGTTECSQGGAVAITATFVMIKV